MMILKKNQSLQIVILETKSIMALTLEIEIIFDNKTYQFEINKISPSKALDVYNFYDHLLKRKNLQLFILHIKILLKMESHEKKKKSDNIGRYTIKIIKTNNKGFIQKKFILINRDSFRK